jgi:serine protease Do
VARIAAGSPAAAAGFEKGDVILSVNGRDIRQMRELPLIVAEMPIGQMVAVTVWRRNTALTLRPIIVEMPVSPEVAELTPGASGGRRSERQTPLPSPVTAAFPAI